jgi:hypothetical protein
MRGLRRTLYGARPQRLLPEFPPRLFARHSVDLDTRDKGTHRDVRNLALDLASDGKMDFDIGYLDVIRTDLPS